MKSQHIDDYIDADVLIVGSGAAGLMCLNELPENLSVVIVSKSQHFSLKRNKSSLLSPSPRDPHR
ncbi:MAG: FAD-binding protein [Planctomycetes bacterium]|nr:FAD-binding protein [Planctomycetota bacterium]